MGKLGGKREGAGRPPGEKNVITKTIKQMVLDTAEDLEREQKGLSVQAQDDPKWFFQHFVKPMLPKEVDARIETGDNLTEILRKIVT